MDFKINFFKTNNKSSKDESLLKCLLNFCLNIFDKKILVNSIHDFNYEIFSHFLQLPLKKTVNAQDTLIDIEINF